MRAPKASRSGRVARRARLVARASWRPAAFALAAGLLVQVLLPVEAAWLPFLAAAGFAASALALFAVGGAAGEDPLAAPGAGDLAPSALLERSSAAEQFGHAFGSGAVLLAALGAGLALGLLSGF